MARCGVCGNDYDKVFQIEMSDGSRSTFDSFEFAIHDLAPQCAHCQCTIIGHGVEADSEIYCCSHCVRESGAEAVQHS